MPDDAVSTVYPTADRVVGQRVVRFDDKAHEISSLDDLSRC